MTRFRRAGAWFAPLALGAGLCAADPPAAEPLSAAFLAQDAVPRKGPGPIKAFYELLLIAYREGVSPVDGPSCPFHPSCSRFARQAIGSHGLAAGILMTGDRLMRCNGSGQDRYPRIAPEGRLHDPPPP